MNAGILKRKTASASLCRTVESSAFTDRTFAAVNFPEEFSENDILTESKNGLNPSYE